MNLWRDLFSAPVFGMGKRPRRLYGKTARHWKKEKCRRFRVKQAARGYAVLIYFTHLLASTYLTIRLLWSFATKEICGHFIEW